MRKNKLGEFEVSVNLKDIIVVRDESKITITPAEVAKVKSLITAARSLGKAALVMPYVQNSPFRILLDNKGADLTLIRQGLKQGEGLQFKANHLDTLVEALSMAVSMHVASQIHRPGGTAEAAKAAFAIKDPPIEGRE